MPDLERITMPETMSNQLPDVAERFMRYVQVDSQSNPENDTVTPSTPAQYRPECLLRHLPL